MAATADLVSAGRDHVVQIYESDEDLAGAIGAYLTASVLEGDTVLVLAVPGHSQLFRTLMATGEADVDRAIAESRLVFVDAHEVLGRMMPTGSVEPTGFEEAVGSVVRRVAAEGVPVRVYGELVALLWEAGDVLGVIELERLWNTLLGEVPFSLFCGYPSRLVSDPASVEALAEVCRLHSDVIGPPTPLVATAARGFIADSHAPRLAREFVSGALQSWGLDDYVEDAEAVVAELATNAVVHAGSDFTVGLSLYDGRIRLEVSDANQDLPRERSQDRKDFGGWGLFLVARIADRWGHAILDNGKTVWADIAIA